MRGLSAKLVFSSLTTATLLAVGGVTPGWSAQPAPSKPDRAATVAGLMRTAYAEMGNANWGGAVSALCVVLASDRNNTMARRYLCFALLQSGDPHNVITQLDSLAAIQKTTAFDLCMRGEALQQIGETDKAVEALRSAVAMDPANDYVRTKLIETLQVAGKFQDASAACAEGYFSAKSETSRARYLDAFNQLQQQRATLASRTLGMELAATTIDPASAPQIMRAAQATAAAASALAAAEKADKLAKTSKQQAAEQAAADDEDSDQPPAAKPFDARSTIWQAAPKMPSRIAK